MAKEVKKGSRANYNMFFEKFKRKPGYIGSLIKNSAGNYVFEISFDLKSDTDEAKDFLTKNSIKYQSNTINAKRALVYP